MANVTARFALRVLLLSPALLLANAAHASPWQICQMSVKVTQRLPQQIEATVLSLKAKPEVECPKVGERITFTPEAADYQTMLPKKRWPAVGKTVSMRYQYLDGECKDRGPCRIEHYPMR